jgi:hypothetical protein
MRHARPAALDELEPLLVQLRALAGLVEKSRGVFYRRSKSFLHFHEDPKGLFGDIRNAAGDDLDRYDVTGSEGRAALLNAARERTGA